ncbi:UDP-Rha/UDP-Gal transporter 3 [Hibiscus trionum]|uniref:UDP-Rha/UDP-Gal transporter 3 n=1 Tax=Hibiscus trionum TaxID=183268 RepID=A0A9W7J4Z4_HIBTR|nr:UDP-Rha/UDP-Gal transporter 3 [Hibiscus trionum]
MSQYLCIGRFSAVSFQVLGHMKTVLGMVLYHWAGEADKAAPIVKHGSDQLNCCQNSMEDSSPVKDVELGHFQTRV